MHNDTTRHRLETVHELVKQTITIHSNLSELSTIIALHHDTITPNSTLHTVILRTITDLLKQVSQVHTRLSNWMNLEERTGA